MERRSLLVLGNEDAGSHDDEHLAAALDAATAAGADIESVTTSGPDEVRSVVEEAGSRTVVVAGGDGSLHVVVQALWDAGRLDQTTLGLIPLGTGNDFARTAGIPLEPEAAGRLLMEGRARSTDLMVDDEGTVVVNASHARG